MQLWLSELISIDEFPERYLKILKSFLMMQEQIQVSPKLRANRALQRGQRETSTAMPQPKGGEGVRRDSLETVCRVCSPCHDVPARRFGRVRAHSTARDRPCGDVTL